MKKPTQKQALKQLKLLKKHAPKELRLAAEWKQDWKVLISTILSAQNQDKKTIPICEELYKKYPTLKKLAQASLTKIKKQIKSINYYKTKAKHIKQTAQILNKNKNKIPKTTEELIQLPGVGRKTANVYLAVVHNANTIGVDTHVARISKKLNWTNNQAHQRDKIEKDLEKLFPKKYYNSINWILVRFGQSHTKKQEQEILNKIKQQTLKTTNN